jgi:hypothetical protein
MMFWDDIGVSGKYWVGLLHADGGSSPNLY